MLPTPTTSGSVSIFELLTPSAILPAAKSKTKNFMTAKGFREVGQRSRDAIFRNIVVMQIKIVYNRILTNSRDTIGLKEDQSGLISSNCIFSDSGPGSDNADAAGPDLGRFCSLHR